MNEKIKVSCLGCGGTNQIAADAVGKTAVCGRCKAPLPVPGRVIEPTEDQLTVLIRQAALPVLIDFYSDTCAPCRMMHPILESLAGRRAGNLTVVRVNTGEHPDLAGAFRIQAVPTFVVMRKGTEVGRTRGAMSEMDFSLWAASVS
ncbi:MAG: thioredoxin family protein [Candidatus Aminicenantales bacterium]